jgi:hypothetical protein
MRRKGVVLFLFFVSGAVPLLHAANFLSFNAIGAAGGGMGLGEIAGAPGASAANWNNMYSVQTTPGGAITGSLAAGTIRDASGNILPTTSLSWTGTGVANASGTGTGSQKMFESEWDLFDNASNTAAVDMTLTVLNVPFGSYDVLFYVQDAAGIGARGGDVTANGVTKSIQMFTSTASIPGGAFSYVQANSPFTFNTGTTQLGTYLRFSGLTGSSLSLTISSKNVTTPRLRFSGFQIVPEPSRALLCGLAAGFFVMRRRRLNR